VRKTLASEVSGASTQGGGNASGTTLRDRFLGFVEQRVLRRARLGLLGVRDLRRLVLDADGLMERELQLRQRLRNVHVDGELWPGLRRDAVAQGLLSRKRWG
jgi:hypothetical protein